MHEIKNESYLEQYFFYRLVKVIYIACLVFFEVIIIALGFDLRPVKQVDYNLSYVKCNNGVIFHLNDLNVDSIMNPQQEKYNGGGVDLFEKYGVNQYPEINEDKKARILCSSKIPEFRKKFLEKSSLTDEKLINELHKEYRNLAYETFRKIVHLQVELQNSPHIIPAHKNYSLKIIYNTNGDWENSFKIWIIGGSIVYLFLTIMKKAILYIAFGKVSKK